MACKFTAEGFDVNSYKAGDRMVVEDDAVN